VTDFDIAQRYVEMIDAAGLPLPDEMDSTPHDIVLRWTGTGLEVHFDRDRDDLGPIDELEAAMMKGLPPDEWPFPTADGYADYVPDSNV
jgi:hypothetical protein